MITVCDPDCGNIIFDCGLRPPFSFSCPNGFEKDSCGCQTSCDCGKLGSTAQKFLINSLLLRLVFINNY